MESSDFIQALAADLLPVSPTRTRSDLLLGLGGGVTATFAAVVLYYGVQPGLISWAHGLPLLMKCAYGLALAGVAAAVLWPLLRPGEVHGRAWRLAAVPVLLLAGLTLVEVMNAPGEGSAASFLGRSWKWCPLRVVVLSAPIFAALCWTIRRPGSNPTSRDRSSRGLDGRRPLSDHLRPRLYGAGRWIRARLVQRRHGRQHRDRRCYRPSAPPVVTCVKG